MEGWWNDTDRRKLKDSEKSVCQYHSFVHHTMMMMMMITTSTAMFHSVTERRKDLLSSSSVYRKREIVNEF
jgi:hypothetical protein